MADTMTLYGSGPRTAAQWSALVASLPQATAVWADLDGMHRAPLPASMPAGATHLWFWDAGRSGRVRIDGTCWIAGVLTDPHRPAPAHCDALRLHDVVVDRDTLRAWDVVDGDISDKRAQQFRGDLAVLVDITQLVPRQPATGVFLTSAGHDGLISSMPSALSGVVTTQPSKSM